MTRQEKEIIVWHEFDGPGDTSIEVLEALCSAYSAQSGVKVTPEVMSIDELGKRLFKVAEDNRAAHVAFVPSDMTAYKQIGNFSEVPIGSWNVQLSDTALSSMQIDGRQHGVPILIGNHLVLYVNREIYSEVPHSWEAIATQAEHLLARGITPLGADLTQSYNFVPFLTAMGGWPMKDGLPHLDTLEVEEALLFLQQQEKSGVVASLDGATTLLEQFIAGKIGAIVTGEWIFNHLVRHMGERLLVGPLPTIGGNPMVSMTSTIGLVFPNASLSSELREELLAFAAFMLEEDNQLLWSERVHRIPASEQVQQRISLSGTANKQQLIAALKGCRPMPVSPYMIAMWVSVEQGLRRLLAEGFSAAVGQTIAQRSREVVGEIDAFLKTTVEEKV